MCVCVYEIVMALINSQLQRQPADCVCVSCSVPGRKEVVRGG